jgi:hypothetical protein
MATELQMTRRALWLAGVTIAITAAAPAALAQSKGKGRIVVYRDDGIGQSGRVWPVELNGQRMGPLEPNTYVVAERAPGVYTLSLEMFDVPGISRQRVSVVAGQTRYYLARVKPKVLERMRGAAGFGIIGALIGAGAASQAEPDGWHEFVPASASAITSLRNVTFP